MANSTGIRIGYIHAPDLNVEALVVLDERSGDTLEIQRPIVDDGQGAATGTGGYCLVRGAGPVQCGGLESWEIRAGTLTLHVCADAATVLELPRTVTVDVSPTDEALVREHLPRLLGRDTA